MFKDWPSDSELVSSLERLQLPWVSIFSELFCNVATVSSNEDILTKKMLNCLSFNSNVISN